MEFVQTVSREEECPQPAEAFPFLETANERVEDDNPVLVVFAALVAIGV